MVDGEISSEAVEMKMGAMEGNVEKKRQGKEIARITKVPNLGKPKIGIGAASRPDSF